MVSVKRPSQYILLLENLNLHHRNRRNHRSPIQGFREKMWNFTVRGLLATIVTIGLSEIKHVLLPRRQLRNRSIPL
jgi:hypothetical protein